MRQKTDYLKFVVLILVCALSGCAFPKRDSLQREYFLFDVVSLSGGAIQPEKAKNPNVALMVQPMGISAAFDKREFVYRTGQYSYETDFYRAFQVLPSILIGEQTYEWMVSSRLFGQVTRPGALVRSNFALHGFINELYGDYSNEKSPMAVMGITYRVLGRPDKYYSQLLLEKNYVERIPLANRNVETLVEGWNSALGRILIQLSRDLKELHYAVNFSQKTKDKGGIECDNARKNP